MSGRYEDRGYGGRYNDRSRDSRGFGGGGPQRRPGDWDCDDCGFHNYASRMECFQCRLPKSGGGGGGGGRRRSRSRSPPRRRGGSRSPPRGYGGGYNNANDRGDNWECPKCNFSNFARRFECMKCYHPKSGGGGGGGGGGRFGGGGKYGGGGGPQRRPGDWNCKECDFDNFASRDACFKCNAPK